MKSKAKEIINKNIKKGVLKNETSIVKKAKKVKVKVPPLTEHTQENENAAKSENTTFAGSNKKNKKPKTAVNSNQNEGNKKELTEKDLKKVEKRKLKKQAQKLKKLQKKNESSQQENQPNKDSQPSESKNNTKKGNAVNTKKDKKNKKQNKEKKEHVPRDPKIEEATVFVGNLPINTKRVQLVRLFKDYAPVNSVRLRTASGKAIFKHKQRLEAGALNAYIVLKDSETAKRSLALNGTEFKGNHLRVTPAELKPSTESAKHIVFVGNLKYSATEESLRQIFSSCGEIEYIRCLRDGEKGCKGVAFVHFKAPESVGLALELNETILDDRPIHVERYSVKKLGAKEKRDANADGPKKSAPGGKNGKKVKSFNKQNSAKDNGPKQKKKKEFRGVKADGMIKKKKKKHGNDQMKKLAAKIAPKIKS